jgi:protein-tyrosine phosphatase
VEGKSRSPSIACIYLMTITGMSWSDTINSLRGVRTLVDPNFAFQRQLKHFYDKLMVQVKYSSIVSDRINSVSFF